MGRRTVIAKAGLGLLGVATILSACTPDGVGKPATPTDSPDDSAPQQTSTPDATNSGGSEAEASTYVDGEYSAVGSYTSPAGLTEVGVTLTLDAGVIADLTVEPLATHANSKMYQEKFVSGINDLVVGKSIDEADVDVVSGSSLTGEGFNNALAQIKDDASA